MADDGGASGVSPAAQAAIDGGATGDTDCAGESAEATTPPGAPMTSSKARRLRKARAKAKAKAAELGSTMGGGGGAAAAAASEHVPRTKDELALMSEDELLEYYAAERRAQVAKLGVEGANAAYEAKLDAEAAPPDQPADMAAGGGSGGDGVELANLSPVTRCRMLMAAQLHHGSAVRNRAAHLCMALLAINRHMFVRALAVHTALPEPRMRHLLSSYSNLEALHVRDATTLPRDFAQLVLRRPLCPLEQQVTPTATLKQVEESWARVEAARNEPVRACMRLLRHMFDGDKEEDKNDTAPVAPSERRVHINPLCELTIDNSNTLTSADVRLATRSMVFLTRLTVRRVSKLTDASFLYETPFPHRIFSLDLAHNDALRSTPIALNADVYARVADERRRAHVEAIALVPQRASPLAEAALGAYVDDDELDRACDDADTDDADTDDSDGATGKERADDTPPAQHTFDYMRSFALLRNLGALSLRHCSALDGDVLRLVAVNSPHLRALDLHTCTWLHDEHMVHVRNMRSLERLVVANCAQLTRDGLLVLCYTTTATLCCIADNQRNIARLCAAVDAGAIPPASASSDPGASDDDDEATLLKRHVIGFFERYGSACRTDMCAFARHSVLRASAMLDDVVADGLSPLQHIDVAYCDRMHGVDMRLFSALPLLDVLILDGCSLFATHYGIDQMFARYHRPVGGGTASRGLVRKFADTDRFSEVFSNDWCPNHIAARVLSTANCKVTGKLELCDGNAKSVAVDTGGVACTERERVEVCSAYKILWAKLAPHVDTLLCGGPALSPKAMAYTAYWASPALSKLDITGTFDANNVLRAFVEVCAAKRAESGIADGAAAVAPLRVLVTSKCRMLADEPLRLALDTFAATLEELVVYACPRLTDAAFASVGSCTRLRNVDVSGCVQLTAHFLKLLANRDDQTEMYTNAATASGPSESGDRATPPPPPIERLNIGGFRAQPAKIVRHLLKCARLKFVTLDDCPNVNDAAVAVLGIKLPELQGLALRRTPCVSAEGIFAIKNNGRGLAIVT